MTETIFEISSLNRGRRPRSQEAPHYFDARARSKGSATTSEGQSRSRSIKNKLTIFHESKGTSLENLLLVILGSTVFETLA